MSDKIVLSDRIKEISYTVGAGNFSLEGAATGFSSFSSRYASGDVLFYAITDGTSYEVGSGIYGSGISGDFLVRFPLRSSNNDSIVSFPAGTKEVYVTYPATHAIFQGSGLSDLSTPQNSGLAFWSTSNILDYDSNLIWDKSNNRLGINNQSPSYAIDIGGTARESIVKSSGVIVGSSGVEFPSDGSYVGGRQTEHFKRNRLDQYAYDNALLSHLTGTDAVFELSGVVNEYILFKQQNAGTVFAGPPSGCTPPCSPAYPNFRPLALEDFPYLDQVSGILNTRITTVSGMFVSGSGALDNAIDTVSGMFVSGSGALNNAINTVSGISTNNILNLITVSGMLVLSSGALNNRITSLSGILDTGIDSVSGMLISSSGSLRNAINTVSGMFVSGSGALNNYIDSVSGAVESQIYDVGIYDLGTISGAISLDWARDKLIQNATLNGFPTTFSAGTGWPTSYISRDLVLKLTTDVSTDITWNIVGSNWYNKPSGTTLNSGEYMFALRAFGSGIIHGFYLGQNTGSL